MHPLWFDPEVHPDKQEIFITMLKEEMEGIRSGEMQENTFCCQTLDLSVLFTANCGLYVRSERKDGKFHTLPYEARERFRAAARSCVMTAFWIHSQLWRNSLRRFASALQVPQTEQATKMDQICSETFCFTQERIIGAIRRKTVVAKRVVLSQSVPTAALKHGEDSNHMLKGMCCQC